MQNNRQQAHLSDLLQAIEPLKKAITKHPVYSLLRHPDDLKVFMQFHVYAVWDFMSLLKSLQNGLTCTSVPWFPKGDANTRFLINEIVVGEESDVDLQGNRKSHFELYLDAMKQCSAPIEPIHHFIHELQTSGNLEKALEKSGTPPEAAEFVQYTFEVIHTGQLHLQSAIFTFGREDLIPNMFNEILKNFQENFPKTDLSKLIYYFERHIQIDADEHGPMAMKMIAELCGDDALKWEEVKETSLETIRKSFDGLLTFIEFDCDDIAEFLKPLEVIKIITYDELISILDTQEWATNYNI